MSAATMAVLFVCCATARARDRSSRRIRPHQDPTKPYLCRYPSFLNSNGLCGASTRPNRSLSVMPLHTC